jgi:hypothetical protein
MAGYLRLLMRTKNKNMKKNLLSSSLFLFLAFIFTFSISHAQVTRVSIANGNWNNPAIWNPTGVPTTADDSIIINTDVIFNQNFNIINGQKMFRVNAGASLTDSGIDTVSIGSDRLVVNGYFSVGVLAVGANDSATVSGVLLVNTDFSQSGTFITQNGGQVCVGEQLATSDDFINNGSVSTDSWVNGAAVTGTNGKFCIANSFINTDAISGNIDICDATPNQFNDINGGTISNSVTFCATGPCGLCPVPNGISENHSNENVLTVFPNPFSTSTQVQINSGLVHSGLDLFFVMYDVNGKVIRNEKVSSSTIVIDRENLSSGIYFYRLMFNGNPVADGKLIAQ